MKISELATLGSHNKNVVSVRNRKSPHRGIAIAAIFSLVVSLRCSRYL